MRVAAYQAPLLPAGSIAKAVELIRERVAWCERDGIDFLCCPEGILGGLADYAADPYAFALDAGRGELADVLAPLASNSVTAIVGFTELGPGGTLFNSAAVLYHGRVLGVYRKLNPAIRRSVYAAGVEASVFTTPRLTFGVLICLDSTFAEPASNMVARGAQALFVPSNNGMPADRDGQSLVAYARRCDIARALENGVPVVRADMAGQAGGLVSYGSSGIIDACGTVLCTARERESDTVVATINIKRSESAR